jgi:hypothetical protein
VFVEVMTQPELLLMGTELLRTKLPHFVSEFLSYEGCPGTFLLLFSPISEYRSWAFNCLMEAKKDGRSFVSAYPQLLYYIQCIVRTIAFGGESDMATYGLIDTTSPWEGLFRLLHFIPSYDFTDNME